MNRARTLLLGAGAIVIVVVMVALTWLGFQPKTTVSNNSVSYKDVISGDVLTAFTSTTGLSEHGDSEPAEPNQVVITGMDDFVVGKNQSQMNSILQQITTFVRARTGAAPAHAGMLNAKFTKTSDNPITYQSTLVVLQPYARYPVTITFPTSILLMPEVTFGEVQ